MSRFNKVGADGCPVSSGEGACPAGGYCWKHPLCRATANAQAEEIDHFFTPGQFEGTWDDADIAARGQLERAS